MAIKAFPSCLNLALTLQRSSREHFLEKSEENMQQFSGPEALEGRHGWGFVNEVGGHFWGVFFCSVV